MKKSGGMLLHLPENHGGLVPSVIFGASIVGRMSFTDIFVVSFFGIIFVFAL